MKIFVLTLYVFVISSVIITYGYLYIEKLIGIIIAH
jgi:hypothetical protein